jgi:plastocyanin domain-containing protein
MRHRRNGAPPALGREVHVRVRGGYEPSTIRAHPGQPVRILFERQESASCSERVIFPDFGKSAALPQGELIAVDLLPERPGVFEFTCQLGMLRGRLIVEDSR